MTDNRNRTVAEIRKIFEKHNGVLGSAGTAAWAFERKGLITVGKEATEDQLMEVAVGRRRRGLHRRGRRVAAHDPARRAQRRSSRRSRRPESSPSRAKWRLVPKIKKPLTGRDAQVALNLAEALDDHDDVQNVYADFDISDEELAKLEGAS